MAVADLNVSRRALLGAAFVLPAAAGPVLHRHPGPFGFAQDRLDPGSIFSVSPAKAEGRWMPDQVRHDEGGDGGSAQARRLARWEQALPRFGEAEAALAAVAHTEDDAVYDRVLGRFNAALKGLLRAPAADAGAVAVKLDLAVRHLAWELTGGEACMAALLRDARRLAGGCGGRRGAARAARG